MLSGFRCVLICASQVVEWRFYQFVANAASIPYVRELGHPLAFASADRKSLADNGAGL